MFFGIFRIFGIFKNFKESKNSKKHMPFEAFGIFRILLVIMWRHGHSAAVCFVCCEFRKLHNTSVCTDAALRSFTT